MRRLLLLLLVLSVSCTTTSPIAELVDRARREVPDVPSVGVAVVRNGQPYFAGAFGVADAEKQIRATADTGYYIASATKSYTGLVCAVLAQQGRLDLDAPVSTYLPELRTTPPTPPGTITLRQFLTHTSGVENDPVVFRTAFSGEHSPPLLLLLLSASKPRAAGFHYDNLGYVVASLVIERVTGRRWQQVFDEVLFAPLGMRRTTAFISQARRFPMAEPHQLNREGTMERLRFVKDDSQMHAAGGIVTTPRDLLRWLAANVNDGTVESREVLPAAAFREAHRQQVPATAHHEYFTADGYGLGWYHATFDGETVLFHLGGFPGYQAHVSFMPERKIGVAVVTNTSSAAALTNFIAVAIYEHLLDKQTVDATYTRGAANARRWWQQQRERFLAGVEERSKRSWTLLHANSSYTGVYEHPMYGKITIEAREGRLFASIGRLNSFLEAFTEPETARVEMVPGSGGVFRFLFDGDATAAGIKWGDDVYRRLHTGDQASYLMIR